MGSTRGATHDRNPGPVASGHARLGKHVAQKLRGTQAKRAHALAGAGRAHGETARRTWGGAAAHDAVDKDEVTPFAHPLDLQLG